MPSRSKLPSKRIRTQAAANLFKQVLLGDAHVGGRDQWKLFSNEFDRYGVGSADKPTFDQDTWKSWIYGAVLPRKSNLALMDDALRKILEEQSASGKAGTRIDQQRRLISRIVYGESLQQKLEPPVGNLVRHLDAIDAGGWVDGTSEDEWRAETLRRANDVLMRLHSAWNPKSGWIYKSFRSDLKIEYEKADSVRRKEIHANAARFKPNLFESRMSHVPKPGHEFCERFSVLVPFSVIPFLLDIALDAKFLVEERLSAWAIDLASAAAALQAIWFAHHNETAASTQLMTESHWLNGFEELFWSRDFEFDTALWRFGFLNPTGDGSVEKILYSRLLLARREYHKFLRTYGISFVAIGECFAAQWKR